MLWSKNCQIGTNEVWYAFGWESFGNDWLCNSGFLTKWLCFYLRTLEKPKISDIIFENVGTFFYSYHH